MLIADKVEGVGNVEEIEAQLDQISKFLAEAHRPKNFRPNDSKNSVIRLEYNYESLCAMLEANGTQHAKQLTIFEFYARLDYLKKASAPKK